MPSSISPENQRRIKDAKESLSEAENELESVLRALEGGARADKKMIGLTLKTAFDKLVAAKAALASVLDDTTG